MATSNWAIPTGKAITGATYIKDTDDNIAATIEDLVDWCNNANGTYTDWTLTGLRTDFVDVNTAQTITAVKTIGTLGAIDFTGGELRIGGVAVTSTAAELNVLDGVTSTTAELNILDGVTSTTAELNILDGVTATSTDLNKTVNLTSGSYTPSVVGGTNYDSVVGGTSYYQRVGDIVSVSGSVLVDATATGSTLITLTMPISSNITSSSDASGLCANLTTHGTVSGVSNNYFQLNYSSTTTSATTVKFTVQYIVK